MNPRRKNHSFSLPPLVHAKARNESRKYRISVSEYVTRSLEFAFEFGRMTTLAFEVNHEIAQAKRKARRAGIDTETDAEFRAVNGLDGAE